MTQHRTSLTERPREIYASGPVGQVRAAHLVEIAHPGDVVFPGLADDCSRIGDHHSCVPQNVPVLSVSFQDRGYHHHVVLLRQLEKVVNKAEFYFQIDCHRFFFLIEEFYGFSQQLALVQSHHLLFGRLNASVVLISKLREIRIIIVLCAICGSVKWCSPCGKSMVVPQNIKNRINI